MKWKEYLKSKRHQFFPPLSRLAAALSLNPILDEPDLCHGLMEE